MLYLSDEDDFRKRLQIRNGQGSNPVSSQVAVYAATLTLLWKSWYSMKRMKTYAYTIHLEPVKDGGYTVTVPALPGCITEGSTFDEAVTMAEECIQGYLEILRKLGKPIPYEPAPVRPSDVRVKVVTPALA